VTRLRHGRDRIAEAADGRRSAELGARLPPWRPPDDRPARGRAVAFPTAPAPTPTPAAPPATRAPYGHAPTGKAPGTRLYGPERADHATGALFHLQPTKGRQTAIYGRAALLLQSPREARLLCHRWSRGARGAPTEAIGCVESSRQGRHIYGLTCTHALRPAPTARAPSSPQPRRCGQLRTGPHPSGRRGPRPSPLTPNRPLRPRSGLAPRFAARLSAGVASEMGGGSSTGSTGPTGDGRARAC
jgi:hypothetical protein